MRREDVNQLRYLGWNSANWSHEALLENPPLELKYFGSKEYEAALGRLPIDEEYCMQYPIWKILPVEEGPREVRCSKTSIYTFCADELFGLEDSHMHRRSSHRLTTQGT